MRRLDYLHGLGVTAICLMPFQSSPCRDDGYDVSDYYNVDPLWHAWRLRRIRPRCQATWNSRYNRPRRQSYLEPASMVQRGATESFVKISRLVRLVDEATPQRQQRMVFPGVQKSTWSYDPAARAWYFHRFYDFQPDLNTSNQHVQAEILKIMGSNLYAICL
jgi:maltose alpha-D-glucosyltransferase/alpha-amylase